MTTLEARTPTKTERWQRLAAEGLYCVVGSAALTTEVGGTIGSGTQSSIVILDKDVQEQSVGPLVHRVDPNMHGVIHGHSHLSWALADALMDLSHRQGLSPGHAGRYYNGIWSVTMVSDELKATIARLDPDEPFGKLLLTPASRFKIPSSIGDGSAVTRSAVTIVESFTITPRLADAILLGDPANTCALQDLPDTLDIPRVADHFATVGLVRNTLTT